MGGKVVVSDADEEEVVKKVGRNYRQKKNRSKDYTCCKN